MNFFDEIVQLSYAYFSNKKVTPEEIKKFIARMKAAYQGEKIDEEKLFLRLESIHIITIDDSIFKLDNQEGHEEWFNVSTNMPIKRHFQWHFWEHFKNYLSINKKRPASILDNLDQISSEILSRIEDPCREGIWDRRGMVMGSVQSGKTSNYTALICKALDAGYKLVIVLTGIHNSLRSQTQDRLNEELLGYDLDRIQRLTGQERRIGVWKMFQDHKIVYTLTNSKQNGDFSRNVALQAGIIPSATGHPIILVIKKIVPILKNLINWLSGLPVTIEREGRRVIPNVPFVLIDDECDFASVDTGIPERDEDGNIVEDYDPTQTNQLIRSLLFTFQKSAYIGYTATPYANIFIHNKGFHPRFGEDLFPRHFVICLPQPPNYIGPEHVFGIVGEQDRGVENVEPLPLIRNINDHLNSIPDGHKKSLIINQLPNSMLEAIKSFLLVCAGRRIRKEGVVHNSMLIHVTRFVLVQAQVKEMVEKELRKMVAKIMSRSDTLSDFRRLWEHDFIPTTAEMADKGFIEAVKISWDEIREELFNSAKAVKVKGINGEIGDILDYRDADAITREKIARGEEVPWEDRGISVIAIGGDKLSRGLTLEGLSVSYYIRTSHMYDTLMQMGRWFGYHYGYNDLCRIYTTEELAEWYQFIALANYELRNDLEYMATINSTPEELGLKVRSHPGRLIVTSAGKSRNTETLQISFEGKFKQTTLFDPHDSANNVIALTGLVKQIGRECSRPLIPKAPRFHWEEVKPDVVINFLQNYKTHKKSKDVNSKLIADYIECQVSQGMLVKWSVVIVSTSDNKIHQCKIDKYEINCVKRKPDKIPTYDCISIKGVTSPSDEWLDLEKDELIRAYKYDEEHDSKRADGNPSSEAIRHARDKTKALLLIYLPAYIDSSNPQKNYGLANEEIVGLAVSFPHDSESIPVAYTVNSIYRGQY